MERFGLKRKRYLKIDTKTRFIFKLIVITILVIILFQYMNYRVEETLISLCEAKVEGIAITLSNKVVDDVMDDVEYEDLIKFDKDVNGKIIALKADVVEMNNISSEISTQIQKLYDELEDIYVYVPLRKFFWQ